MGLFARVSGMTAVLTLAGTALTAALPAAAAQAAPGAPRTIQVPCRTSALIAAIHAANGLGSALIVLPANCTYDIFTPVTAADGLPVITGQVALAGGAHTAIRRGSPALFRILDVAAGASLSLNSVSILDGRTSGLGGGILNAGTLLVRRGTFSDNSAGNGGAVSNSAGATARISDTVINGNKTTSVGGGAIINFGNFTVTGSFLSFNKAPINGGAINTQPAGVTRISNSHITGNTSGGLGGGLSNLGTLSLDRTQVTGNEGSAGGGIATGNTHVTLRASRVRYNIPDNCNPLNTIPGCTG